MAIGRRHRADTDKARRNIHEGITSPDIQYGALFRHYPRSDVTFASGDGSWRGAGPESDRNDGLHHHTQSIERWRIPKHL